MKELFTKYEPVLAAQIVGALFVLAAGLGLRQVDSLKDEADAILTFLAFGVPLVAGTYSRSKVAPIEKIEDGEVEGVYTDV